MELDDKIDLLWDRFVHQSDTYSEQRFMTRRGEDEAKWQFRRVFDGYCNHEPRCAPRTCPDIVPASLTRERIAEHIDGTNTVGVYQTVNNTVKWVCFDVDISKDSEIKKTTWENIRRQTKLVAKKLYSLDVPFLVEFSGNKGMHLWVFFETPVQATHAFAFGNFVLDGIPVHPDFHIELYPKQANVKNIGNLVKLPLGIHRKSDKRTVFVRPSFKPYDDQWAALAKVRTMTADDLDALLDDFDVDTDVLKDWKVRDVDSGRGLPCYTNIMIDGVGEGSRDLITFYLSVFLKNHGFPEDVAFDTVSAWNEKSEPPLDDLTVREKVQSAFSRDYSHFACLKSEFDPYCESHCQFYENRMRKLNQMNRR